MNTAMNGWKLAAILVLALSLLGCRRPSPLPTAVREKELDIPKIEGPASEQARRVLVVCNTDSEESLAIAEYYATKRGIPESQILQVRVTLAETTTESSFRWDLQKPIQDKLQALKGIDFIVLTKGIPIRVHDSMGHSVDSLLAGMELEFEPVKVSTEPPGFEDVERMANPFFNSEKRFSHEETGMYLVTRLDGYEVAEIKRAIDAGLKARPVKGPFYLDVAKRGGEASASLNDELRVTAAQLKSAGFVSQLESTPTFVTPKQPVMGYVSWGSNDPDFSPEKYRAIRFLPGAITETFVSTSGRSFLELTDGQSQIADLIRQGVTGAKGYVSEPWTLALARPSILFDRYTKGWTMAESFYAASPVIKWKDIVIGDPLVAPYASE